MMKLRTIRGQQFVIEGMMQLDELLVKRNQDSFASRLFDIFSCITPAKAGVS